MWVWRALALATVLGAILAPPCAVAQPRLTVVYPRPESTDDARTGYPVALLRLALEHSEVAFDMHPSEARTQQARTLRLLESGRQLDVAWSVATTERARRLLAIDIPIDRGLIGWRVLLIRADDASRFQPVDTKADLAPLGGVQGQDWPDLEVLRDNGLRVYGSRTYPALFEMLRRRHADYLPRSVAEVLRELDSPEGRGLRVEPRLLLHYPSALYFFVSPHDRPLAEALRTGLQRAIADGSMQRLFERTYGADLRALKLPGRRVIELDNPLMPFSAPLAQPHLWYRPEASR